MINTTNLSVEPDQAQSELSSGCGTLALRWWCRNDNQFSALIDRGSLGDLTDESADLREIVKTPGVGHTRRKEPPAEQWIDLGPSRDPAVA
jgi:hypothetical protein